LTKTRDESKRMFELLKEEISEVAKRLRKDPKSQCWRRIFVRSVFSMIESECYRLKENTLSLIRKNSFERNKFSPGDISLLEEKAYSLDNKGRIEEKSIHLKTESNLRFAFSSAAKFSLDFKLDVSDTGWESFKKAIKIRHRVTHPKKISDLSISDEEKDSVKKAFLWFIDSFKSLKISQSKYHAKKAGNLKELIKEIDGW